MQTMVSRFSRIIVMLSLIVLPLFAVSSLVFADTTYNPVPTEACQGDAAKNPACTATDEDPITGPNGIIMKIANLVAFVAGTAAVLMIIFAGFRLIKSGGDSSKVTVARETIIYSLVGLVVIVAARLIVGLVISKI